MKKINKMKTKKNQLKLKKNLKLHFKKWRKNLKTKDIRQERKCNC